MKKFIPVLLVLLMMLTVFSSCSKSEAAKACEEKIKAIGDVDLTKITLIEEAEKAYAFLSAEDKGDVKNFDDLSKIREQYNSLKEFDERAEALCASFDRLFSEYGVSCESIIKEYEEMKETVQTDDSTLKAQYESIFSAAEEKYQKYLGVEKNANTSAAAYIKGFLEVQKAAGKTVTVTEIGCIAQINDETEYFLFALTYQEDGAEKKAYANARFAGTPPVASFTSKAENFYGDAPASEKTDALISSNVLIDTAAVLSEAA